MSPSPDSEPSTIEQPASFPIRSPMKANPRTYERTLLAVVVAAVTLAAALTWWDAVRERRTAIETNLRVSAALARTIDLHLEATIRDGSNAALSAALLIERAGALPSPEQSRRLRGELKRELPDNSSTARL